MPLLHLIFKAMRMVGLVTFWVCMNVVLIALTTCCKCVAMAVLPHALVVDYFVDVMCCQKVKVANSCNSHRWPLAVALTVCTVCIATLHARLNAGLCVCACIAYEVGHRPC